MSSSPLRHRGWLPGDDDPQGQRRLLAGMWLVWGFWLALLCAHTLDAPLSGLMRTLPEPILALFRTVTTAGLAKWYLVPLGLGAVAALVVAVRTDRPEDSAWWRRLAWVLIFLFAAVALSALAGDLLKVLAGRARPKLLEQSGLFGFAPPGWRADEQSFPSGHTITVVALALALGALWPRWRWPLLVGLALPVAASRVVINAHFLGDVIGGGALAGYGVWRLREGLADCRLVFRRDAHGRAQPIGWPQRR